MPIRINLLAEAQALEEIRRRDPVKRSIFIGVGLVALVLVWSSSLMFKTIVEKSDQSRLDAELNSRTNDYRQILENDRKLNEYQQKLVALHRLSTNRFLMGNLLDAMQKCMVDNAQLVRLRLDQTYVVVAGTSKTNGTKFQDALSGSPYFKLMLGKTNGFRLTNLGQPQSDPDGKPFVLFTLEARFPEKTR
jgi:hypothetical protein